MKAVSSYLSLVVALLVITMVSTASIIAINSMERTIQKSIKDVGREAIVYRRVCLKNSSIVVIKLLENTIIQDIVVVDQVNNSLSRLSSRDLSINTSCRFLDRELQCSVGDLVVIIVPRDYRVLLITNRGVYIV